VQFVARDWGYITTATVDMGTTVRPSTALRAGIGVTATDRPGGVAEAAEEKAV